MLEKVSGVDYWLDEEEFPEKPNIDNEEKRSVLLYDPDNETCVYEAEER